MEEREDSPDFWSGPIQYYNSPVVHRFLIGLHRSTIGPLLDCDRKYVSVRTMPPEGDSASPDPEPFCHVVFVQLV